MALASGQVSCGPTVEWAEVLKKALVQTANSMRCVSSVAAEGHGPSELPRSRGRGQPMTTSKTDFFHTPVKRARQWVSNSDLARACFGSFIRRGVLRTRGLANSSRLGTVRMNNPCWMRKPSQLCCGASAACVDRWPCSARSTCTVGEEAVASPCRGCATPHDADGVA